MYIHTIDEVSRKANLSKNHPASLTLVVFRSQEVVITHLTEVLDYHCLIPLDWQIQVLHLEYVTKVKVWIMALLHSTHPIWGLSIYYTAVYKNDRPVHGCKMPGVVNEDIVHCIKQAGNNIIRYCVYIPLPWLAG